MLLSCASAPPPADPATVAGGLPPDWIWLTDTTGPYEAASAARARRIMAPAYDGRRPSERPRNRTGQSANFPAPARRAVAIAARASVYVGFP